jgi:hypothetical protein
MAQLNPSDLMTALGQGQPSPVAQQNPQTTALQSSVRDNVTYKAMLDKMRSSKDVADALSFLRLHGVSDHVINDMADVAIEVMRYRVIAPIPLVVSFKGASFNLRNVQPELTIGRGTGYDPLRAILCDVPARESLTAAATESSGSLTATMSASAGLWFRCRALQCNWSQGVTQAAQYNAVATFTVAPWQKNSEMVDVTQVTSPLSAAVTENTFKYKFDTADVYAGVYVHPASKQASLIEPTQDAWLVKAPTSGTAASSTTIACAGSNLVSGSGIGLSMVALSPGTSEWYDYVAFMLSHYYGPIAPVAFSG